MEVGEKLAINGPHCTSTSLDSPKPMDNQLGAKLLVAHMFGLDVSFDHVLNVPATEVVWPQDVTELFFGEFAAMRLVGSSEVFCNVGSNVQELIWSSRYRYYYDGVIKSLFGSFTDDRCSLGETGCSKELASDEQPDWESYWESYWYDYDSQFEDDDEPDTLNSELLLTEEYLPAVSSKEAGAPDVVSSSSSLVVSPHRRVGLKQPTEQEG